MLIELTCKWSQMFAHFVYELINKRLKLIKINMFMLRSRTIWREMLVKHDMLFWLKRVNNNEELLSWVYKALVNTLVRVWHFEKQEMFIVQVKLIFNFLLRSKSGYFAAITRRKFAFKHFLFYLKRPGSLEKNSIAWTWWIVNSAIMSPNGLSQKTACIRRCGTWTPFCSNQMCDIPSNDAFKLRHENVNDHVSTTLMC